MLPLGKYHSNHCCGHNPLTDARVNADVWGEQGICLVKKYPPRYLVTTKGDK